MNNRKKLSENELREAKLDSLLEEVTYSAEVPLELRDEALRNRGSHNWLQRGIEVYCDLCPNQHGFYVTPNVILKGMDDNGKPILDKIKLQSNN